MKITCSNEIRGDLETVTVTIHHADGKVLARASQTHPWGKKWGSEYIFGLILAAESLMPSPPPAEETR